MAPRQTALDQRKVRSRRQMWMDGLAWLPSLRTVAYPASQRASLLPLAEGHW